MTITTERVLSPQEAENQFVEWADRIGRTIAEHTAGHDRDGTFVAEAYDIMRAEGYLALAVPTELGGHGATIRQVAMAQRALARHCSSTALASVMHHHVVLFTAWRYRRGMPGAEATLRRVADEGIVIVSTGGADLTHPRGNAERVEGGFRVSGRKIFVSQSPVGAVMSTMFPYDDPEEGRIVLNVAVPLAGEGVTVLDNWDALGMRGTGSNDVELEGVFVPDERVLANRPYGVVDGPLQVISSIAFPIISGVYLGVAESAYQAAKAAATHKSDNVLVQRQLGLMKHKLQVASWALDGALAAVGEDPTPSHDTYLAVMIAKAEIAQAGIEVCDLAMDVAGGPAFFRGSVIERAYRDIRAAKFHPLTPDATHVATGREELGVPGLLQ